MYELVFGCIKKLKITELYVNSELLKYYLIK